MNRFRVGLALLAGMCICVGAAAQDKPPTVNPKPPDASGAPHAPAPRAGAADAVDISESISTIITKHNVPGMVAAVTTGKQTVLIGAAGTRAANTDSPVHTTDVFHIGSCTKSMTAALVALLVQDGTLTWTTTVGESFPEFAESMHKGWNNVTLTQLLTNRSGAPADLSADGLWAKLWTHTGTAREQRLTLAEGLLKRAPDAAPGEKFIYSNAGFAIAGLIAERATTSSWEALMRDRLFKPLGMNSAGFGAPGSVEKIEPGTVPDVPWGHTPDGRPIPPGPAGTAGLGGTRSRSSDNPGGIGPAGIVHCAIEDWAAYVRVQLRGHAQNPEAPIDRHNVLGLSPGTFATLHSAYPAKDENQYAMGWGVATRPWAKGTRDDDTGRVLTHSGSNTMWFCIAWLAPERDFAVLVMCNQGGDAATKACDEAAGALIAQYLGTTNKK